MKKKLLFLTIFITLCSATIIGQIKSDNGLINVTSDKYIIQIILINDPKIVINDWDNTDTKNIPGAKAKTKFKVGDTVVPFIIFLSLDNKSVNLKYNCNLLKPTNIYSTNRGENLKIVDGVVQPNLFYRTSTVYGWTFDESDPLGFYQINIQIFDNNKFKQDFILKFELEK